MSKRILVSDDGMVLTDGVIYGMHISLGVDRDPSEFWQITQSEYEAILSEEEAEQATEADYQAALQEFGVEV